MTYHIHFDKNNLHHAYLIEGKKERVLPELKTFLVDELNFPTVGNPDFSMQQFDTLTIDEGRQLKEMQSRKPVRERKIFIIVADSITREAQNALLKMFEEPASDTHFFIIVPSKASLLPTLLSRLQGVTFEDNPDADTPDSENEEKKIAQEFIKSSAGKRTKLLKDIIESKDEQRAIRFLNELEQILYAEKNTVEHAHALQVIARARQYLHDRAPSVKMLLEHVALVTPKCDV